MTILLDVSRLLSRMHRRAPTGIDRVELAYALHLLETRARDLTFVRATVTGRIGRLPFDATSRAIRDLTEVWFGSGHPVLPRSRALALSAAADLSAAGSFIASLRRLPAPPTYLLVSHHHLDRPAIFRRLKAAGVRIVCLVHDLIPMLYPEYARPGHDRKHALRMRTVARFADGIIFNSAATEADFSVAVSGASGTARRMVAWLGHEPAPHANNGRPLGQGAPFGNPPYFVCLGTIEPRKNHLLLLHIWRQLAARLGEAAPRLVIIGHRGWENENIVDLLDRSSSLRDLVEERSGLNHDALRDLLRGAKALLMPSFAEGFGLPVIEALAAGLPVICSDLPVFREIAGDVPETMNEIDGLGWMRMIEAYARPGSRERAAQLRRIADWRAPTWREHFAIVDRFIEDLDAPAITASRTTDPSPRLAA